jgi:hypothetical protein
MRATAAVVLITCRNQGLPLALKLIATSSHRGDSLHRVSWYRSPCCREELPPAAAAQEKLHQRSLRGPAPSDPTSRLTPIAPPPCVPGRHRTNRSEARLLKYVPKPLRSRQTCNLSPNNPLPNLLPSLHTHSNQHGCHQEADLPWQRPGQAQEG